MFKLNLNRADRNALVAMTVLIILITILGFMMSVKTAKYQPRPITITPVSEESLFDLKPDLECTAGSGKEDSPYSVGLTPGGLCGAQLPVKLAATRLRMELVDL